MHEFCGMQEVFLTVKHVCIAMVSERALHLYILGGHPLTLPVACGKAPHEACGMYGHSVSGSSPTKCNGAIIVSN